MKRSVMAIGAAAVLLIPGMACDASPMPSTAAGPGSESPSATGSGGETPSAPAPATSPAPAAEERTITETEPIPYKTKKVNDSTIPQGQTKVRIRGVPGIMTLTYRITVKDGVETGRKLVRKSVTRRPVTRVVAVGTKPKPSRRCDPNYSGCVPIASDVDCAGGSGNGPAYAQGPVRVIGTDIYDLDDDGDGLACE